ADVIEWTGSPFHACFRPLVAGVFGMRFGSVSRRFWKASFARGILLAALVPQGTRNFERIDIALLPPLLFLTCRMDVVMGCGAKRTCELVPDLQPEPARLRVADVVSIRGRASADHARLTRHKTQMLLGTDPLRFTKGQSALVNLGADSLRRSHIG